MSDIFYHKPVVVFDLDDTLFKERDYVFSAFRRIDDLYSSQSKGTIAEEMTRAFLNGENFISAGAKTTGQPESEILHIYRMHKPNINLDEDTIFTLDSLRDAGIRMAIITDGRETTQTNKFEALGLDRYIPHEMLLISEKEGADKLKPNMFAKIVHTYPEAKKFIYIGDNPRKDFIWANMLGWETIMLLDNNLQNIHTQADDVPPENRATKNVDKLSEILTEITPKAQ
jgi:putative hydrolase of the HAD superfamily